MFIRTPSTLAHVFQQDKHKQLYSLHKDIVGAILSFMGMIHRHPSEKPSSSDVIKFQFGKTKHLS